MSVKTASLIVDGVTPVETWQKLLEEHNFSNRLVIVYESGRFLAGYIKNIKIEDDRVMLTPSEIWRMSGDGWKKMDKCLGWNAFDVWLKAAKKCGDFYLWTIGDVGNIYIYTGDDPIEGFKQKKLPPIIIN